MSSGLPNASEKPLGRCQAINGLDRYQCLNKAYFVSKENNHVFCNRHIHNGYYDKSFIKHSFVTYDDICQTCGITARDWAKNLPKSIVNRLTGYEALMYKTWKEKK